MNSRILAKRSFALQPSHRTFSLSKETVLFFLDLKHALFVETGVRGRLSQERQFSTVEPHDGSVLQTNRSLLHNHGRVCEAALEFKLVLKNTNDTKKKFRTCWQTYQCCAAVDRPTAGLSNAFVTPSGANPSPHNSVSIVTKSNSETEQVVPKLPPLNK